MQRVQRGSVARAVVAAERTEAQAFNVVALLKGRNPQLAPLIITTPRSGWWHCACERGGGLVCWLECMRLLSESSHDRDVLFAAFSGHELGFIGVDGFTATRPGLEQGAFMWLHFGASIGPSRSLSSSSVVPASLRFSAPDEDIARLVRESMASERITEVSAAPPGTAIGGESVVVHQRGGKVIALLGSSPLFHLEADRWPVAVDVSRWLTLLGHPHAKRSCSPTGHDAEFASRRNSHVPDYSFLHCSA